MNNSETLRPAVGGNRHEPCRGIGQGGGCAGARGVQGLVVACTGNGTIHHDLEAAVACAERRSAGGALHPLRGGAGAAQAGDVLPASQGLSPVKARLP